MQAETFNRHWAKFRRELDGDAAPLTFIPNAEDVELHQVRAKQFIEGKLDVLVYDTPECRYTLRRAEYSPGGGTKAFHFEGECVSVKIERSDPVPVICFAGPPLSNAAYGGPCPLEIVWMPAGVHEISAGTPEGGVFNGRVVCDEAAFKAVLASFESKKAEGQRVWLDVNHTNGAATADVENFSWDPDRGIIAHVKWTPLGEDSLRSRLYTSFSPAFFASKTTGEVFGLLDNAASGGLVNEPAFRDMPSLT